VPACGAEQFDDAPMRGFVVRVAVEEMPASDCTTSVDRRVGAAGGLGLSVIALVAGIG
jgi:hypothetical protein